MKKLFEEFIPPMKDMLKSRIALEAEVEKNAEVQSDNWFNFNAEAIANVQAVNVGVLEAAEDGEAETNADQDIDVWENFVKISEEEENSVKMSVCSILHM